MNYEEYKKEQEEYDNELNVCMEKGASAADALNSVLSNSLKR